MCLRFGDGQGIYGIRNARGSTTATKCTVPLFLYAGVRGNAARQKHINRMLCCVRCAVRTALARPFLIDRACVCVHAWWWCVRHRPRLGIRMHRMRVNFLLCHIKCVYGYARPRDLIKLIRTHGKVARYCLGSAVASETSLWSEQHANTPRRQPPRNTYTLGHDDKCGAR